MLCKRLLGQLALWLLLLSVPAFFCKEATLDLGASCTTSYNCGYDSPFLLHCINGFCEDLDIAGEIECRHSDHCAGACSSYEDEECLCIDGRCSAVHLDNVQDGQEWCERDRQCEFGGSCVNYLCYDTESSDPECRYEGDCDDDMICDEDRKCVPVTGQRDFVQCLMNRHCPYGTPYCVDGVCGSTGPGVECRSNEQCPLGLCIDGTCASASDIDGLWECEESDDCDGHHHGRNVRLYCRDRKCVVPDIPGALTCYIDKHCPDAAPFCVSGVCSAQGPGKECAMNHHCNRDRNLGEFCTKNICGSAGPGVECTADSSCGYSEKCSEEGLCYEVEEEDGDPGRRSLLVPECMRNECCDSDEYCTEGVCGDEGPGVQCFGNSEHCGEQEICVNFQCEPVEGQFCNYDDDCRDFHDFDYACVDNTCVRECYENSDCRSSQECDIDNNICVENGFCGDGVQQYWLEEWCDDGNVVNGDGCSSNCKMEPVSLQPLCDLVQSCGSMPCKAKQSTYYSYDEQTIDFASDGDGSTCLKTADAIKDPNPQWVRVDLSQQRLISTVRFAAAGGAADFTVIVANQDAGLGLAADQQTEVKNPTYGGRLPDGTVTKACSVKQGGDGVLEATCPPATKGQFVFIRSATPKTELEVCEVEVFAFECVMPEEGCGLGYQPSECSACAGCVPCPASFYSDKVGDYQCTPCPGNPQPYSPPGSTSVFQCQGYAYLEGTSTLGVEDVEFNTTIDGWEIVIDFVVAPRIQLNGVSSLFMSKGGDASPANDDTFQSKNFPCRADTSRAADTDTSTSLEETVCCLQEMRQDYVMTKIFRDFTDGLDLVAANDKCDAADGSNMLIKGVDLEVVGDKGTSFVDTNGDVFSSSIKVELLPSTERRDGPYIGKQRAKITIPDAELYKVSKTLNSEGNLHDSRKLFIGLLDLLPTGTRVVDSSSQQISIVLTRTQYGTFAAYGKQNIDYDFISFLNGRAYRVLNQEEVPFPSTVPDTSGGTRNVGSLDTQWDIMQDWKTTCEVGNTDTCPPDISKTAFVEGYTTAYFAEISFVWDDRMDAAVESSPVPPDSVRVVVDPTSPTGVYWAQPELDPPGTPGQYNPCTEANLLPDAYSQNDDGPNDLSNKEAFEHVFLPLVNQKCGPSVWEGSGAYCPQVSIANDNFGRIYIPLMHPPTTHGSQVKINFELFLQDRDAVLTDAMKVSMVLAVDDLVTYCDAAAGSVDLAERVIPRIIVGSEANNPPRLDGWKDMDDGEEFSTGAETLQDGLVTLILDLNETTGLDDNLEVFFEDVLVIHVNPGSQPDFSEIKAAITSNEPTYLPTYTYNPDSRDAQLHIPPALKTGCPEMDASEFFFGCVHKHILRDKAVTSQTDAYLVGSAPPPLVGAQEFVATMLGDGTAKVAARELGRDYESYLMAQEGVTGRKSIGLWINPGHKWGQTVHHSEYSLSNHLIIYVLFGVRSGVDETERRMLLSTNGDGTTSLVRTLEYNVNAASLMESVMDKVIAIEVEARLALSDEEACLPLASLREVCSTRLEAAVAPHASKVERVECVSVHVNNADCDGRARRAAAASAPVAVVDAVIALAEAEDAFLDMDAVVASGSVLAIKQASGATKFPSAQGQTVYPDTDEASGSGISSMLIGAGGWAVAGVMLVVCGAWKASKRCRAPPEPLQEVVSTSVVRSASDKDRIEDIIFQKN